VQRVVVLATPVVRIAARGAKFTRLPGAMVASSSVSVGLAVRTGVREIQVLSSLVAHRIEQATGAPADAWLVEKVAVDLYLDPKRKLDLTNDRLPLVRLTRKWVGSVRPEHVEASRKGARRRRQTRREGSRCRWQTQIDEPEVVE
jgi:hypothetical protein